MNVLWYLQLGRERLFKGCRTFCNCLESAATRSCVSHRPSMASRESLSQRDWSLPPELCLVAQVESSGDLAPHFRPARLSALKARRDATFVCSMSAGCGVARCLSCMDIGSMPPTACQEVVVTTMTTATVRMCRQGGVAQARSGLRLAGALVALQICCLGAASLPPHHPSKFTPMGIHDSQYCATSTSSVQAHT